MSPRRRSGKDPALRAALDGAQVAGVPWAPTLASLTARMEAGAWYRLQRVVQLRWRDDGEASERRLARRDVRAFAAMCHAAASPGASIDGQCPKDRADFADGIESAARFLAERLSREDVRRSQSWDFQPIGCDFGEFIASLDRLRRSAEAWREAPAWHARKDSALVFFAHSLRESMRSEWRPPRPDWHLIHAAAVAVLGEGAVPESMGPNELPAHLRRLTAASRPTFAPGG